MNRNEITPNYLLHALMDGGGGGGEDISGRGDILEGEGTWSM